MKSVFVDTSGFYAALNRKDRFHLDAASIFDHATRDEWRLITSNFVVAETHALILMQLGHGLATAWLRNVPATVLRISREDEQKAIRIILDYRDKV